MPWWEILLLAVGVGFLAGALALVGLVVWIAVKAAPLREQYRRQMATPDR